MWKSGISLHSAADDNDDRNFTFCSYLEFAQIQLQLLTVFCVGAVTRCWRVWLSRMQSAADILLKQFIFFFPQSLLTQSGMIPSPGHGYFKCLPGYHSSIIRRFGAVRSETSMSFNDTPSNFRLNLKGCVKLGNTLLCLSDWLTPFWTFSSVDKMALIIEWPLLKHTSVFVLTDCKT